MDLEALLTAAYARSVGVDAAPVEALVGQAREALAGGELDRAALVARRGALRRVEMRCLVSRVQGQFLDRVLA